MVSATGALKERLQADIKVCLKAGEKAKLGILRLILAAIKQREIDDKITVDDDMFIVILDKMLKQRKESIVQYEAAKRNDLANAEAFEAEVIREYLPEALSDDEIEKLVRSTVTDIGATTIQQMGLVMAKLKPQLQGRADMSSVSSMVKRALSKPS